MRRVLPVLLLAVLTSCYRGTTGPVTGSDSAADAVGDFLAAGKARDLQALGAVWGTSKGAARDYMERAELEQRELIIIRMICHDTHRVVATTPGLQGRNVLRTELTRGTATVAVNFTTIRGPSGRWYVEELELDALQRFCRQPD